jgi:serine/threonine-protein kinase
MGRYVICAELASGGMATVYLARVAGSLGAPRFCALKVIRSGLMEDQSFVEMFIDEADIATQAHHAHVCQVFDFDRVDGIYYLAMEYLVGEPLWKVHKKSARGEHSAEHMWLCAKVIADACEGLHAVHELCNLSGRPLHVVHRDVSPQNLMLTYDGVVKVVDFGLASAALQRHKTSTGILKGKFPYVPPEILRGRRADRRGDVWSLGVILWELLTGERLFRRATDLETLKAVGESVVPLPSQVSPNVPHALDRVVMRALERDRQLRYTTAREMGKELNRALVQSGTVIGYAELSHWMHELFPEGLAQKRNLLETAVRDSAGASERTGEGAHATESSARDSSRARLPESGRQCTSSVAPDLVEAAATRLWQRSDSSLGNVADSGRSRRESARARGVRFGWTGTFGVGAFVVLTGVGAIFWHHGFDLSGGSRSKIASAAVIAADLRPRALEQRELRAELRPAARPVIDVPTVIGKPPVELTNGPYTLEITSGNDPNDGVLVRIRARKSEQASAVSPPRRAHQNPVRRADGGALAE